MINWRSVNDPPEQSGVYLIWVHCDQNGQDHFFGVSGYKHPNDRLDQNRRNALLNLRGVNKDNIDDFITSPGWKKDLERETSPDLDYYITYWAEMENSPHGMLKPGHYS